ncbi:MAG: hypothetical protein AAGA26_03280 [Pseudomonadota bacterium]
MLPLKPLLIGGVILFVTAALALWRWDIVTAERNRAAAEQNKEVIEDITRSEEIERTVRNGPEAYIACVASGRPLPECDGLYGASGPR